MDSDAFLEQEYENLNDAILRAILKSEEVQGIIARFKNSGQLNEKAVLNLFLSLDELHQMINESSPKNDTYKLEPDIKEPSTNNSDEKESKPILKKEDVIDGQLLTLNEVLFEKFFQGSFNENTWMKKARVRF
jgi:hypothetical protein